MNFVIVVIDTLRHDHIGAHGNEWIKTPNLDRLIEQSWDFSRSYCASYPTIPHRTDAITGRDGGPLYPWKPLRWDVPTLPRTLGEEGWATQLIHDTPHLINGGHNFDWPFHAWTQIHGAEVDRPWIDTKLQWPDTWTRDPMFDFVGGEPQQMRLIPTYVRANRLRSDHESWNCARLFRTAAAWMHDNLAQERFLLWVDCFDPHEPWDVPPEFAVLYDPDTSWDGRIDPRAFMIRDAEGVPEEALRRVAALYAAKVTWVDRWLGELLDAIDASGRAHDTCVIVTADHGTSLNERGYFGKRAPIHVEEGHTPFIVRLPGGEGGTCDAVVQPQDLAATVADLAGVAPPEGSRGFNLMDQASGGAPQREVAVGGRAAGPWWIEDAARPLVTVFDGQWQMHLSADPAHCRLMRADGSEEVAADHPRVVERLRDAALDELTERGTDERVVRWLRSGGDDEPSGEIAWWDGYPGPRGFTPYFGNLWEQW